MLNYLNLVPFGVDPNLIGEVKYDAKNGGGSFNKFGKTADKIRPLLNELLSQVKRPDGFQLS